MLGAQVGVRTQLGGEREVEGMCQAPGSAVDGNSQPHSKGGFPTGSSVWSACPSRQTSNLFDLADGAKKKREREQEVCSLFQKVDPGIPGCVPLLLVFSFLNKPPGFLRSSKSH